MVTAFGIPHVNGKMLGIYSVYVRYLHSVSLTYMFGTYSVVYGITFGISYVYGRHIFGICTISTSIRCLAVLVLRRAESTPGGWLYFDG